jgi:hypothetical protein
MYFGVGQATLLIINILITPKIISKVTERFFEDTNKCQKITRSIKWSMYIISAGIYSFLKDEFIYPAIIFSFISCFLIIIYIVLVGIVVAVFTKGSDNNRSKSIFENRYEKYKFRRVRNSKELLTYENYIKKESTIFAPVFFILSAIFFIFLLLIGKDMLVKGIINITSILLFIFCYCFFIFTSRVFQIYFINVKSFTKNH